MSPDTLLILIAPNVSQQMGGEGVKALQIFEELTKLHPNTLQITHGRNRAEIARLGLANVEFIDDDRTALFLWRSRVFAWGLDVWFSRKAIRLAEKRAAGRAAEAAVLWQTEPNSPVVPRRLSRRHLNAFGPINGNIYYPPLFRHEETFPYRMRRVLHRPLQWVNACLPGGIKGADEVLVAGGERTRVSLRAAGCTPSMLRPTVDCGIGDALLDRPRIRHRGRHVRFVHCCRLVVQKGTVLVIESLARTRLPVELDIIGDGPELQRCRDRVAALGLDARVRFFGWAKQEDLFRRFADYRGSILPSIEDSNGIVIQEAMALGLPPICLDWGGPSLLIEDGRSGFLVKPETIEQITTDLAAAMDRLAEDGALAESMSVAGRETAEAWRWSRVAAEWLAALPTTRRVG